MNSYLIPTWPAPPNVKACTTTRQGGVSKPPYASFNLSFRSGDRRAAVVTNHYLLQKKLQLPSAPFWLTQEHGKLVIPLTPTTPATEPVADGSFTTTPNLLCAVLTADCIPILLCDRAGTVVAALHVGWRGLAQGIIATAIKTLNTKPDDMLAWLGPAIGPTAFLTGPELRNIFIRQHAEAHLAFRAHHTNFLTNIYLLATQALNRAGVTATYGGEYCTFTQTELFFSFRREGNQSGRMASLIWLTT